MLTYDERTNTCYWQQENDEKWEVVMFGLDNVEAFYSDDRIQEAIE